MKSLSKGVAASRSKCRSKGRGFVVVLPYEKCRRRQRVAKSAQIVQASARITSSPGRREPPGLSLLAPPDRGLRTPRALKHANLRSATARCAGGHATRYLSALDPSSLAL